MGSHSYLVNLQTNIGDLHTSGLLNSHASRDTTTNVGHMVGDRTSVISLGELQELGLLQNIKDRVNAIHFTKDQAAKIEAKYDKYADSAKVWINADSKYNKLSEAVKERMDKTVDASDAKVHSFVDAHTDSALQEMWRRHHY